jgi:hypothetical protein
MTDSYFCRACGARYIPNESRYCTKCGQPIQVKDNLANEIKIIQREPKPYEALRIVSGFIVLFGWVIIIVGWITAFSVGDLFGKSLAQFVSDSGPFSLTRNFSFLVSFVLGSFSTIQGLFMIAAGQVFMVLLDIRNDTHTTMRLVARLGLAMLEKQDQPSTQKESAR